MDATLNIPHKIVEKILLEPNTEAKKLLVNEVISPK